jgi:orotidine-5'-phosphate decarboxylase
MENTEKVNLRERVIVALDTANLRFAKKLVRTLKDSIKVFKIGTELFTSHGPKAINIVRDAGAEVFLDLKFHDIPNTVAQSARAAVRLGVFMFNVHASGGLQMMQEACVASADEASKNNLRAPKLIAVTLLTSLSQEEMNQEIGIPGSVDDTALRFAELVRKAGLDGVVASAMEVKKLKSKMGAGFLIVTPGIRPTWAEKGDQTRVVGPRQAFELGSDFIVIGRPITEAKDPQDAARRVFEEIEQ